jgi:CTP:molybdopterin cytidylyltransferase MocA
VTEKAVRAVVLAAGSSSRTAPMQKLLVSFRGRPLVEYAIDAASAWHPVVVAGPAVARALRHRTDCTVLANEHPERGMSYSLKIADGAIERSASLLVFLGDKPLISRDVAQRIAGDAAQVAFPVHGSRGMPGHPVLFDASVRPLIPCLPDGDTLHLLRDDPAFSHRHFQTIDDGVFFDVDEVTLLDAISR